MVLSQDKTEGAKPLIAKVDLGGKTAALVKPKSELKTNQIWRKPIRAGLILIMVAK